MDYTLMLVLFDDMTLVVNNAIEMIIINNLNK